MINALTNIILSPIYLFLAQDLTKTQEPEAGIEQIKVPFEKAYEMVIKSEITLGPSCVAILKTKELVIK